MQRVPMPRFSSEKSSYRGNEVAPQILYLLSKRSSGSTPRVSLGTPLLLAEPASGTVSFWLALSDPGTPAGVGWRALGASSGAAASAHSQGVAGGLCR